MRRDMKSRIAVMSLSFLLLAALALAGRGNYIEPDQADLTRVLAPAPANDSPVTKADLAVLLKLQAERTPAQEEAARADVKRVVTRFADVLGPAFEKKKLPVTEAFFKRISKDASLAVAQVKNRWSRPRPFTLSHEIKPCVPKPASPSYPSGHSTWGHLAAIVLADMVPEKAAEIFARGDEFARQRLIGGVHYPSDVEAGKIAAAVIASALYANEEFKRDFALSRAEVRKVLGLSEN